VQEQDCFQSYAINLGAKIINKNVKNLNQQVTQLKVPIVSSPAKRGVSKNFKEDNNLVLPVQDTESRSFKKLMQNMQHVNSYLDKQSAGIASEQL